VAHSITLIARIWLCADVLWFPPLIEMLIAMSIVYMGLENIVVEHRPGDGSSLSSSAWCTASVFPSSCAIRCSSPLACLTSLLFFNVGVEIGQLFVLLLFVPPQSSVPLRGAQRLGTIILSALVVHQACIGWKTAGMPWNNFAGPRSARADS